MGTYHTYDHVVNGTVTIDLCSNYYKVCQEEVYKRGYYNWRWQNSEDEYTVCGICREKLGFQYICKVCFCISCQQEKECMKGTQVLGW